MLCTDMRYFCGVDYEMYIRFVLAGEEEYRCLMF